VLGNEESIGASGTGKEIAMLEKAPAENGYVSVTFRVSHYIWADSIALVGDFNGWDVHSHPLHRTREDGEWHITVALPVDRKYRFRYLVDGKEWMDDDHPDGCEPNPFGGFDSVVLT
jgi:1,4-alpha-glucan branching enzyme